MPRVRFPAMISDRIGGVSSVDVPGDTVMEVVQALCERFPALDGLIWDAPGRVNDFLVFFVNKQDVRDLGGLDTPLNAEDEITVIGAAEGG